MKKKLILVFTTAFLMRLVSINQSLWLDETTTAKVVKIVSYFDIVPRFSVTDFHPPLYYWVMKFWVGLFGNSEVALRIPSVLFSLATGYVIYLIGKSLKNDRLGLWAALFFLFNPIIIYYSQEARMYMMATFIMATALLFFMKLLPNPKFKIQSSNTNLILFSLFCVLSFYTFYGSIFLIVAMQIVLLLKKQYKNLFISCCIFYVACLPLLPLFLTQLQNSRIALLSVKNWSLVLGKANIKNLALIPIKFTSGRISFEPKLLYYILSGSWLLVIGYLVIKGGLKQKLLGLLIIVPLVIGLLISFVTPLLQYFRFLYVLPILCLLIAFGISRKWLRWAVLVGFITWSFMYLLVPKFHREDWRSLVRTLPDNSIVYGVPTIMDPMAYYNSGLQFRDIRKVSNDKLGTDSLTVLPYVSDLYGVDYQGLLQSLGYHKRSTVTVRGLQMENWTSY